MRQQILVRDLGRCGRVRFLLGWGRPPRVVDNRLAVSVDVSVARNGPDLTASNHQSVTSANGEIAVDRHCGFAVIEARAVYFHMLQTCSPIHIDNCSLKTRWTTAPPSDEARRRAPKTHPFDETYRLGCQESTDQHRCTKSNLPPEQRRHHDQADQRHHTGDQEELSPAEAALRRLELVHDDAGELRA